jgi:hypothetical protein
MSQKEKDDLYYQEDWFKLEVCFNSKAIIDKSFCTIESDDKWDENPTVKFLYGLPISMKAELIKEIYKRLPSIVK